MADLHLPASLPPKGPQGGILVAELAPWGAHPSTWDLLVSSSQSISALLFSTGLLKSVCMCVVCVFSVALCVLCVFCVALCVVYVLCAVFLCFVGYVCCIQWGVYVVLCMCDGAYVCCVLCGLCILFVAYVLCVVAVWCCVCVVCIGCVCVLYVQAKELELCTVPIALTGYLLS